MYISWKMGVLAERLRLHTGWANENTNEEKRLNDRQNQKKADQGHIQKTHTKKISNNLTNSDAEKNQYS